MTADEIREEFKINMNGSPESCPSIETKAIVELAAQVAELNESRKPRWVNLPTAAGPRLIDATQVVGLSSGHTSNGMEPPSPCAYIRLRSTAEPLVILDRDHDEVRALLGIDEEWMNPPRPVHGRVVSDADYAEMMTIINVARNLAHDHEMISTSTGSVRENLVRLDTLFDSFDQLPF